MIFGTVTVYTGFKIENFGNTAGLPQLSFSSVAAFVMTEPEFISEPVAASVNTVPSGKASSTITLRFTISHASPSYFAPATINLEQSITEPPPTARTRSISSFYKDQYQVLLFPHVDLAQHL